MNQKFRDLVALLEPKYRALLEMEPVRFGALPREIPKRGIYLFSEGGQHLYVGRTNGIRRRLQNHCRLSGTHYTATFAFRIARQTTGQMKASYAKAGSRDQLSKDPVFRPVNRTGFLGDLIAWEDGVYGTSKSVFSGGA